jgi:hypothetical protein
MPDYRESASHLRDAVLILIDGDHTRNLKRPHAAETALHVRLSPLLREIPNSKMLPTSCYGFSCAGYQPDRARSQAS